MSINDDDRALVDLLRQDRLDYLVQVSTELADRERQQPGSVPDLAAEALYGAVSSWSRILRLGVRT